MTIYILLMFENKPIFLYSSVMYLVNTQIPKNWFIFKH